MSTLILRAALFIIGRRTVALVKAQSLMVPWVAAFIGVGRSPAGWVEAVAGAKQAF